MRFFKFIILVFLLQSCNTAKYILKEDDFTCFDCNVRDGVCSGSVDGGAGKMDVRFSEISIKGNKIHAKGTLKEAYSDYAIDWCNIYLGKKISASKYTTIVFLQKRIALIPEDSINFEFKSKFKNDDIIMFYTVGYQSKTFQIQCTENCKANKDKVVKIKKTNESPPSTQYCKRKLLKHYQRIENTRTTK